MLVSVIDVELSVVLKVGMKNKAEQALFEGMSNHVSARDI